MLCALRCVMCRNEAHIFGEVLPFTLATTTGTDAATYIGANRHRGRVVSDRASRQARMTYPARCAERIFVRSSAVIPDRSINFSTRRKAMNITNKTVLITGANRG